MFRTLLVSAFEIREKLRSDLSMGSIHEYFNIIKNFNAGL